MNKTAAAILALLLGPLAVPLLGAAALVSTTSAGAVQAVCTVTDEPSGTVAITDADPTGEGGIGFTLPEPGEPRLASLTTPAATIPEQVKAYYLAAAQAYQLPWTLLAGIGMEETAHGRTTATSSAGARGLMQFMPATWARYGVDGDGDGQAVITNDADSVMSAANYLTASGVTAGVDGVRDALWAYNHADWYVNDVLFYAAAYGGGVIAADPGDCGPGGTGNPDLPAVTSAQVAAVLTWATAQLGEPYVYGSNGPDSWDCSAFTRAAFAQVGITLPRTAAAQQSWVAQGNGYQVPLGQERPGDLIFTDSYLGPNRVGHVMIVFDPDSHLTIEAGGSRVGHYDYTYWAGHNLFSIWRVGAVGL